MKNTYKLLFLFVISNCLVCAASLSGTVKDVLGGAVPNAVVAVASETGDENWNTRADPNGIFRFEDVPAGNYLVSAHAPGFASYRLEHVQMSSAKDLRLALNLELGAVQQEVSVTASSTPQPIDQVSKALSLVSSSTLEERDMYSLIGAVQLTPGVRIAQQGGPGSFSEIRLRGLGPQDTAVLVDGLRLRDPAGTEADATSLLDDFLVADTNRIEILRGSGSSLYGTNAIGGVVNVITDQGGGPMHGSLQLEGGDLGLFRGTAMFSGGVANDRLQYSVGITHLNVTQGVNGNQPARTSVAQGRVSYRINPTTEIAARFFGSDGFAILSSEPVGLVTNGSGTVDALAKSTFTPSLSDPDYHRTGRYETGALSLTGQPNTALGYGVDYQAVNSTRTYENGPAGVGFQPFGISRSDYNGSTQTVNARANYQAGQHNLLTSGYEFENEFYNSRSTAIPDNTSDSYSKASQSSNSVYGQDQIRMMHDKLYLSLGGRAQFFSPDQPNFTPAAAAPFQGARFTAPPAAYTGDGSVAYLVRRTGTKIRGHVGRGYRAPSLYQRFGAGYDSFFGYSVYGDPRLQPEQSIAVDGGIDQALVHDRLHLSATYFYTHLQRVVTFDSSGVIDPATDPFGRFFGYLNTRGGLSRGAEGSAQWAVTSSLTFSGAYTYTDAREESPLVPGVYRSFITPANQFSAMAVQRMGKRIFVDLAVHAASNYLTEIFNADFTPIAYRFPGEKHVDAGASYRIPLNESKALRLYVQAENLLNQAYYESGFQTPGLTARGGLQFQF